MIVETLRRLWDPMAALLVGLMALVALALVALALVAPGPAHAAEVHCKDLHATAESSVVVCDGPLGICTQGRVTGDGLLGGTTLFVATGLVPEAGLGDPTIASDAGTWTLTTAHGTLTANTVGMLHLANNLFLDMGTVSGGTGRFDGATGTVFFYGTFTEAFPGGFPDLTFSIRIRGEVCLLNAD